MKIICGIFAMVHRTERFIEIRGCRRKRADLPGENRGYKHLEKPCGLGSVNNETDYHRWIVFRSKT